MKRIFGILIMLLLSITLLVSQEVASLLKVVGEVEFKRSTEDTFSTATVGITLSNGDVLKTGEDGIAALLFKDDKSLIKIRKNSIVEVSQEFGIRTIKMDEGKALVNVTPGTPTVYRIETPTSVASVKGTQFWVITTPGAGDRFYGIEGIVEVVNLITGQTVNLNPGMMVISTPDGQLLNIPVSEDEIPKDEEEYEEQPREQPVEQPEVETAKEEQPIQPVTPSIVEKEPQKQPQPPEEKGERPYGVGLGLGSVTLDGKIYNQFALRPEVQFGKLGIGLDLVFYFDQDGNLRRNEWDEFSDYLDKIYYLRYGTVEDPFFIKVGALDNVTLGYGILMNGYSNTTEYPQVRKVGIHGGFKLGNNIGIEGFLANIKELFGPGLMAGRVTYKFSDNLPLILGGTIVIDANQYSGMKDTDKDGVPDEFDAFPDKKFKLPSIYPEGINVHYPGEELSGKDYNKDTDKDGIPDELDFDIDGDGMTDNFPDSIKNFDPMVYQAPDPFNIKKERKTLTAISIDAGYPILNMSYLRLDLYGQAASFLPFWKVTDYRTGEEFTPGWGIAAPGLRANIIKFISAAVEYRLQGDNFLYGFWDRVYDFERVSIRTDPKGNLWPYTKDQIKLRNEAMQGVYGFLSGNILNYVVLTGYYQHMFTKGNNEIRSFLLTLDVPKNVVPKLAGANVFYQRNNDKNPFDFKHPSENTIWGYRISFETGGGVIISYVNQTTYRDRNGDGKISPKNESISLSTIETSFSF
ncbi:MAG: FecR domain-containing protein [Candidatus Marinimicrobia bacterium]|nr:FecR domain-containing protein [Candidatus Neomarinimicrobiota bacterium]